ncbi:zinc finger protein [Streptomyces sp. HUAS MG91]|uniref:Zinc finger protein n=1 Tax=Streptomyces tabacisoli TaxID=3156398 RepID=A0AAU8IZK1_9ACTN
MAATENWRCGDCDTFNVPAERVCAICGGTRRGPGPAAAPPRHGAPRPAAKRPAPARPAADWRCTKCDTNNTRDDTTCLVCGAGWKTAAKPAVRKKGPAKRATKRPPPKKTTPAAAPAATPAPAPAPASTPRRESLFHPPPVATGYVPTAPIPTPTPPPAPAPAPRPWTPPPPRRRPGGCGGCLIALVVGGALLFGAQAYLKSQDSGTGGTDGSGTAAACPTRIADELPSGGGAELVEAYRTENKQITLCRTTAGELYYYGEFSDHREAGIAMRATTTSDGYEASNDPYRYVIHGDLVTIYKSDAQIGEETVTPEPSPQ